MALDSTYLYPKFDQAPSVFYCKNLLLAIESKLVKWIKIYNDKWGTALNYTLVKLESNQFLLGFPVANNSRGLYCFAIDNPKQNDDGEENVINLGLVYSTGTAQLDSTAASQYGNYLASSFWLEAIERLVLKLCEDNCTILTNNWPAFNNYYNASNEIETTVPSRPAHIQLKTIRKNPDADINNALAGLGLRGYLEIQLTVTPYEIPQPNFSS